MSLYQDIKVYFVAFVMVLFSSSYFKCIFEFKNYIDKQPVFKSVQVLEATSERYDYEFERIKDQRTNSIPANIHQRELELLSKLPKEVSRSNKFKSIGPFNKGGRTRAGAFDIRNSDIILAGGVSGGIWKTINGGDTWREVNSGEINRSVSTIVQDSRTGKNDTWYYGSGEKSGNSASKSFSAFYGGTGIFKSTDNGESWVNLIETKDTAIQNQNAWDFVYRVVVDPSNTTKDIVYAAIQNHIMRSEDGGETWKSVLESKSEFTDVAINTQGVVYSAHSESAIGNNGGIYRSDDGINWVKIKSNNPPTTERIVIGIDPNDENRVYFFAHTPNFGQITQLRHGAVEGNSLWKYYYLKNDGAGTNGQWDDLSQNLPDSIGEFGNMNVQGGYDMAINVHPIDSNYIFLGGTNIYRSKDAFKTNQNIDWIGGYQPADGYPFYGVYSNHHPDQHWFAFDPSNSSKLLNTCDGGIYITENCFADSVEWIDLNNGYTTTQFYTVAINQYIADDPVVIGGMQDNGTWWTDNNEIAKDWKEIGYGDGSYCAIASDGETYYLARQNGVIGKFKINKNGEVTALTRIDPKNGTGYIFISPYTLDRFDDNYMYNAAGYSLYYTGDLNKIPTDSSWEKLDTFWNNIPGFSGRITTLEPSPTQPYCVYVGTSSRNIYKVQYLNTDTPKTEYISDSITVGGYTSDITINPLDENEMIVVFSNYNTISIYHTVNGGKSWQSIEGNLKGETEKGTPSFLYYIGNGPSIRSASICNLEDGNLYLLGTSIGLFGTKIIDGESTQWKQLASESVGSSIVDMIAYRPLDGTVALATHGGGVYSADLNNSSIVLNQKEVLEQNLILYPNPTSNNFNIILPNSIQNSLRISIYNILGERVYFNEFKPNQIERNTVTINTSNFVSGSYLLTLKNKEVNITKPFIVNH